EHPIILKTGEEHILGEADEGRIEQVLDNLISNALKYGPADKPIVVTVECQTNNPDEVLITVRDEGQGISKEVQHHVFERFYRVHTQEQGKVEGLGLGLYISHEI